jgi:Xaa-Pro aminopeptidase
LTTSRLDRLRSLFSAEKVDCLLVSGLANIRYLTGFTGRNALLLVQADSATFFTDGRYTTQARQEIPGAGQSGGALRLDGGGSIKVVTPKKGLWAEAIRLLKARRRFQAGFDSGVSFALSKVILKELGEKRTRAVSGLVERLRLVKEESEIAAIRASAELNSQVLAEILPLVRPGMTERLTERDLAAEVEYRMRRRGATGPSFESIVAAGENSALPHAHPTARAIRGGEFLLFDHGTMLDGYCSDMTRTVWVGGAASGHPSDLKRARDLYATVLEAHQLAREAVRAGVHCSVVDRAARRRIAAQGWGKYFSHSTGHGVGLEIHELPRVAATVKDKLPAGAVITIEPGVYLPGFGGVRIEDMVVVRENGAEGLTPSPKEFMEL